MNPVCFHIGNHPIYWYGVMVAIAFLAAVAHWNLLAAKGGRPQGYGSELGFWIMLSGIIGARIAYVIANFQAFAAHPIDIIRIDQGGLIFYGGFIGAVGAVAVFARFRKDPLLWVGDLSVSALPLGHGIGRIGCFMNGCCYGTETCMPWGVYLEEATRHPTQLYEAGFNFLLYAVLLLVYRRKRQDGIVLATYLMLYPAGRFALEFLRGDERQHLAWLSIAQVVSILLFVCGLGLWLWIRRGRNVQEPASE